MSISVSVPRRKTLLVILDGFGVNPSSQYNAVHEAKTPCLDYYFNHYEHTTLRASGRSVGLPAGQMGNSEVGHLTIGSGSIVRQDLVRIDDAIADGSFEANVELNNALLHAKEKGRPLHLMGLVSHGGVHSHTRHLIALLQACKNAGVKPVVHAITDGRDTPPRSARGYMEELIEVVDEVGGQIASVCGRYYAMDRDKRWERTQIAWNAYVKGVGVAADDALSAINDAYAEGLYDEFITPRLMPDAELIQPDDALLFFNFRNDRPRQMSAALAFDDFSEFERGDFSPVQLTTMTVYEKQMPAEVMFQPERAETNLAEVISQAGLRQLHCAETEKYAHVTFFFNSGKERPYPGEKHVMIESPKVDTYDLQPEMSADKVADAVIESIQDDSPDFIVVNFANGDMVGHTAIPEAIVKAVEAMDKEVGRVLDAAVDADYSVLLTADHGNCEEYLDPETGEPHTQHTVYPVPCLIIDASQWHLAEEGGLSDIAPTILAMMGLNKPESMTGRSIFRSEMTSPLINNAA